MAELINQIALWIEAIILKFGYPGIWLVMTVENLFPPVPTDPLLPFAGILAARGEMQFVLVWMSAVLGAVTGSLVLYGFGRWADERVIRDVIRRYGRYLTITEAEFDRATALFNRYGAPAVFFGRAVPMLRSVVSISAGLSKMALPKFIFFTSISSVLVTLFWIGTGYILGENWRNVMYLISEFEPLLVPLLVIVAVIVVSVMGYRFMRQMSSRRKPTTEFGEE